MWQLSDSFSDEKNHKAVSHPAVLLMLIKLNYPLLALMLMLVCAWALEFLVILVINN